MKKLLSFEYKYVFFPSNQELYFLDNKSHLVKEPQSLSKAMCDPMIESWIRFPVMTGKNYSEFFKRTLLLEEHSHLFRLEKINSSMTELIDFVVAAKKYIKH